MSTCVAQPGAAQRWPARPWLPQPVLLKPGQKPLLCSAFKEMPVPRCCSCGGGAPSGVAVVRACGMPTPRPVQLQWHCGHSTRPGGSSFSI